MQQRQLRLGDILDDYCPRERRVTNHAVVAMIGDAVKQTRCTTCDTEHEYKQAKIPRQRRKNETPAALYAQVAAGAPKRVTHDPNGAERSMTQPGTEDASVDSVAVVEDDTSIEGSMDPIGGEAALEESVDADQHVASAAAGGPLEGDAEPGEAGPDSIDSGDESIKSGESIEPEEDDGPVHRPLIRASLPRPEGQQPPARPIPEFTIRQPGGRPNRFRPRNQRGAAGMHGHHGQFQGNRSNGNMGGGSMRGPRPPGGGRPGGMKRHGPPGRKRSK
jgi:hypothetical protein